MRYTNTTSLTVTSLQIAHLVIKKIELSLVPPGGHYPLGINYACLFMFKVETTVNISGLH
jgi:hypothetical protein